MSRHQLVSANVNKKYTVTSPAGTAAVLERIRILNNQAEMAILEESRDIYLSVVVMLEAMLEAGDEGITVSALLSKALAQYKLSAIGQDDAMYMLTGHMAQVRETVSKQT